MIPLRILRITLHVAIAEERARRPVDEEFLRRTDRRFRELLNTHPEQAARIAFSADFDEPASGDPWEEIDVELRDSVVRKQIGPLERLLAERLSCITNMVLDVFKSQPVPVRNVISLLSAWMLNRTVVHVIGAGRALLAASLPANRLAHGGANVFILGDKAPPPNSRFGGGILAVSASGKTPAVLDIMNHAKQVGSSLAAEDRDITTIGLSNPDAESVAPYPPFRELCTNGYFLGVCPNPSPTLRALADLEELAIAELLDALVVIAGHEIGVNFRLGHEDLVGGATGPWHQHKTT